VFRSAIHSLIVGGQPAVIYGRRLVALQNTSAWLVLKVEG
jgi:hypothetical protein